MRSTLGNVLFYVVDVPSLDLHGYIDAGLVESLMGNLQVVLCFILGLLLSLGAARNSPSLPC